MFLLLKDEILFGKEWVCWHLIEKGLDLAREGKKKERVIECACLNERQRDREKEERTKTMIASERQRDRPKSAEDNNLGEDNSKSVCVPKFVKFVG